MAASGDTNAAVDQGKPGIGCRASPQIVQNSAASACSAHVDDHAAVDTVNVPGVAAEELRRVILA
jgi:hypothetical protein